MVYVMYSRACFGNRFIVEIIRIPHHQNQESRRKISFETSPVSKKKSQQENHDAALDPNLSLYLGNKSMKDFIKNGIKHGYVSKKPHRQ